MQGVIVQQQQHPSVHFQAFPQVGPPGMSSPRMPGSDVASGESRMSQALGVRTTRILGVALLISGIVMGILQIICTALVNEFDLWGAHQAGTGIWCGIIVIICGIIGCCAASYKTNALVISFLVFNVMCTVLFAPIIIGTAGGDISITRFCKYNHDYSDYECNRELLALTWLLLMDALFVFGISIFGIVINSVALKRAKGCCSCCYYESHVQPPIVMYVPINQMPGVIGQPPQYVAVSGRVHPQSQVFQVPYAQPLEVPAGTAVASTSAYSAAVLSAPMYAAAAASTPTYSAAAASASAPAYAGATTEPPPYQEKM